MLPTTTETGKARVMPDDCIFCKIVSGEIPAHVVLDTDSVRAFLDISPIAPGHTLVLLKRHVSSVLDAEPEEAAALFAAVRRVAAAVQSAVRADAFNIELNDGPAAGQEIPHVHVHVIPRYAGDGALGGWRHAGYAGEEPDAVADRIRADLPPDA
jgi:histidine triad (HIT) family protein